MSRVRKAFVCRACGAETPRWEGRCPKCGEWNSLDEHVAARPGPRSGGRDRLSGGVRARPLGESGRLAEARIVLDFGDVDRVLGGGLVPGSCVLIGGSPGIGKSTLLLQIVGRLRDNGHSALYVSGEESARQVGMRAERLGTAASVDFLDSGDVDDIIAAVRQTRPSVLCVDSIQAISAPHIDGSPGGVSQVRECASLLREAVKTTGTATFLVGHVTKGGTLAGPRTLEHLVDAVLHFEGQRSGEHRLLRGSKNRFGGVDEVAAFRMSDGGLVPVLDPAALFLPDGALETSGAAVAVPVHGSRPLPVEVQALVARARFSAPQRVCTGFPARRLAILLAVLERRAGIALGDQDVFVNVVGGLRVSDPAADLAVVSALVSAGADRAYPTGFAFFGEVGLGGEVRGVPHGASRASSCRKAGITTIVAPVALRPELEGEDSARFVEHVRQIGGLLSHREAG